MVVATGTAGALESLGDFISVPSSDEEEDEPADELLAELSAPPNGAPSVLRPLGAPSRRYAGADPFLVLHEDVKDFLDAFVPTVDEHAARRESLELIAAAVGDHWPGAEAIAFGSFASGLYLPSSDVDVGLRGLPDGSKRDKERTLRELAQLLRERGLAREDASLGYELEVIASARVPIIRFVSSAHLTAMDLTLDADSGAESTRLMCSYANELPEFAPLVVVLKLWLQRRGLHETFSGGIGSYLLQVCQPGRISNPSCAPLVSDPILPFVSCSPSAPRSAVVHDVHPAAPFPSNRCPCLAGTAYGGSHADAAPSRRLARPSGRGCSRARGRARQRWAPGPAAALAGAHARLGFARLLRAVRREAQLQDHGALPPEWRLLL